MPNHNLRPILKWAGGKRQLENKILNIIKNSDWSNSKTYFEPFLGGGAIFFALQPTKAVISDINAELINVYNIIKEQPQELINELTQLKEKHSKDYYYQIRNLDRNDNFIDTSCLFKAARTIYLNRTCFNGLYRVNQKGFFNTPIGSFTQTPTIVFPELILEISQYLSKNNIKIKASDYHKVLQKVKKDDFVYLDPPYAPISKTSSFTSYTKFGFPQEEQESLLRECELLDKKGAKFLLSNSNTELILNLYNSNKNFRIIEEPVRRNINSIGQNRNNAKELLITNF